MKVMMSFYKDPSSAIYEKR